MYIMTVPWARQMSACPRREAQYCHEAILLRLMMTGTPLVRVH